MPEGSYELSLKIYEPPGRGCLVNPAGTRRIQFDVNGTSNRASDEPLDLGDIEVEIARQLDGGDAAPVFDFAGEDETTVSLRDFHGKCILIDFWATWCVPCAAQIPALKSLYAELGKDDRFVMISLSLDKDKEAARRYTKRNQMNWLHGFLGDWTETDVPGRYGVSWVPAMFVIGPDGKLIAKGHAISELEETVKAALAEK